MEYRKVIARLKKHDRRFRTYTNRGKGSHRMVAHPDVGGRKRSYPLPYHGAKTEIRPGMLSDLVRMFGLPEDFFRSEHAPPPRKPNPAKATGGRPKKST